MSSVRLNVPILVKNIIVEGKSQYFIRPLFFSYPVSSHRRYENAVQQFQKNVREYFKGYQLNRESHVHLLWYKFNPIVEYRKTKLSFRSGNQFINGTFEYAFFNLKGMFFVSMPAFNNYMFVATPDERGKYNFDEQVETVIKQYFRKLKQKNKESIEVKEYVANEGDFLTTTSFYIKVEEPGFNFGKSGMDWFFQRMGGDSDFVGSAEIHKVGTGLNNNYPVDLKQSFFQDELLHRLYNTIFQIENTPIVLIGKEGVGKHSAVEQVLRNHIELFPKVEPVHHEFIWHIDPTRVISGMSIVGMWQKRFEAIIKFIQTRRSSISFRKDHQDKVLIDNPIALLRIGKSSQNDMTLSDVLKPYLEERSLQVILLATPEQWKIVQEKDRRFADLFQVFRMDEPNLELASKMVIKQRKLLEIKYDTKISNNAVVQLFAIHRNYFKNKSLPGNVMKLMTQMAVKYKFQSIDVADVKKEFGAISGMNQDIFDDNYTFENGQIKESIKRQLIGQDKAINSLAKVIHVTKSKLNDPTKPLSSMMFIGPTGVGKTQAAKVLSKYLMGNEDALMRFDMNEFITEASVQRLIGDYYNPEGQLTGKIRYRPFGVILLDEIEKAHPKVYDLLLQVLDDGRLTDSLGRTVDFTNTIIIMTSNIGARQASTHLGFNQSADSQDAVYRKALSNHFRPEFLNRIDEVIIFQSLEKEHIHKIAQLQIKELLNRDGFLRRTTFLDISDEALKWVAERGFNKKMGGRALKRQIEKDLTVLSAEQLIKTNIDSPIIFQIKLIDNQLVPSIIPLHFTKTKKSTLPNIPEEKKAKGFYKKLLRTLTDIDNQVKYQDYQEDGVIEVSSGEDLDWMAFHFKNQLSEIKEAIFNTSLDYNKIFINSPVLPLRLKRVVTHQREKLSEDQRRIIIDDIVSKEALKELEESYEFSSFQFDKYDSQLINDYLNVFFIEQFSIGYFKDLVDNIEIRIESCIRNQGQDEVKFLIEQYKTLMEGLDINHDIEDQVIYASGYHIFELFKSECGIHLFYPPHQAPIPIKITLKDTDSLETKTDYEVIRVYNSNSTISDLRSGYTTAKNLTLEEFKLLIYWGNQ